MVKHELRVESLKAGVEIQKCEFTSTSYEFKSTLTSSNPRVTSPNLRVMSSDPRIIKSMKTQSDSLKSSSFPKKFVKQLVRSVSGDNLLFYIPTTPWPWLQQKAE